MKNYTSHFTSTTPQSRPMPEARMVPNRAGGWGWEVDDKVKLGRWLMIGTEGPAYYASQRDTARENATCIERLLETDGKYVVDEILRISEGGNAPKQEPAIMALAMCLKMGDLETRRYAATVVPRVCRTFTHLASLGEAVQVFGKRGWGRVTKRAIGSWFASKSNEDLAYQLVKYRNRQGWTAKDLLRLSHPNARLRVPVAGIDDAVTLERDEPRDAILRWALGKPGEGALDSRIVQFEELQKAKDPKEVARIVRDYRMPWETVPSAFAKDLEVQAALFEAMPMTAMIRQLARLTSIGLLTPGSSQTKEVWDRLGDPAKLARARIHPMQLFLAARTYDAGQGVRGHLSWTPVQTILDALSEAFVASFKHVQPSGRKLVVGVDFSSSMGVAVMGVPGLSAREAALAQAFVLHKTEPQAQFVAFTTHPNPFNWSGIENLQETRRLYERTLAGMRDGTDCSMPIWWANESGVEADAFILLTDEETWAGREHPLEALGKYREKMNLPSRIVSVGFAAHGYTIRGQYDDAGALAIVGFDNAAPGLIQDFLAQPDPIIPQLVR